MQANLFVGYFFILMLTVDILKMLKNLYFEEQNLSLDWAVEVALAFE